MLTRWRVQVLCICVWSGWRQAADTSHLYSDTRTLDTRRQQHRLKIYPLQYFTNSVPHSNNSDTFTAQCRPGSWTAWAARTWCRPRAATWRWSAWPRARRSRRWCGAGRTPGRSPSTRTPQVSRVWGKYSEVVISTFRFTHWLLRYGWWIVVRQQRFLGEVIGVNVYRG